MTYRTQEILFGTAALVTGTVLMVHTFDPMYAAMAQDLSIGPMFFPRILFTLWLICAGGITYEAMRKETKNIPFLWLRVLAAFATLLFFAAAINYIGFFTVGVICFFALSWIIGYKDVKKLLLVSIGYTIFVGLLFRYVLQAFLPSNQLFMYLIGG